MMQEQSLPPAVVAAVIGAAATIALALLTWVGRAIAQVLAERRELNELLRAFHAEVTDKLEISEIAFKNYNVEQICEKMRKDKTYTPFITLERYSSPVFESFMKDIPKFPASVIKPVIDFYRWDRVTHAAFETLMTDKVKDLEVDRRIQLFTDAATLWEKHLEKGRAARTAIEKQVDELDHPT